MQGRSSDEAQIVQLLARYSWAADARDVDALLELFDEDVDTRTPAPNHS
jgi:ketosteroid isomerase-like protein